MANLQDRHKIQFMQAIGMMCLGVKSVKFPANEISNLLSVAKERARVVVYASLNRSHIFSYLLIDFRVSFPLTELIDPLLF